ncbi:LOW QUALITY PROTEIN: uncharacterized protein [Diabrotica undecimpunctata]|uniref:LOW QUALITY PROTEIN: uncharacterized protein n=1 Tax=Diabrotica undecimpunctata TaxID=50387 RepID=UPI003B637624
MVGSRVYVGGLPYGTSERDLERFFRGYDRMGDVLIKNGYGFVEFEDYRDADDAVYELNGKKLLGERVTVERARGTPRGRDQYSSGGSRSSRNDDRRSSNNDSYGPPTRTNYRLLVENLSSRISWQDLKDYMRQAREVTYADAHKEHRNEGVVEFASYSDMKNAIEKLDDTELNGRKLRLVEDKKNNKSRHSASYSSRSKFRSRSRSARRSRSHSRSSRSKSKSRSRSRSQSAKDDREKSKSRSRSRSNSRKKSDGSSDTEQECEDDQTEGKVSFRREPYCIGKDKLTKWKKHCPPKNVRTRSTNILIRLPAIKEFVKTQLTPIDIWNCIFDEEMLNLVVDCTNIKIESVTNDYNRQRDVKPTLIDFDIVEIKALIGLLYLAGIRKANHMNLGDLWRTDGTGIETFRLVMSKPRFQLLLECLRFDNIHTTTTLLEKFNSNIKKCYSHSAYVTIDEKLEAFRGKGSFRQYIPSKPE